MKVQDLKTHYFIKYVTIVIKLEIIKNYEIKTLAVQM